MLLEEALAASYRHPEQARLIFIAGQLSAERADLLRQASLLRESAADRAKVVCLRLVTALAMRSVGVVPAAAFIRVYASITVTCSAVVSSLQQEATVRRQLDVSDGLSTRQVRVF